MVASDLRTPLRHDGLALLVSVADDQHPLLRGEVEAVLVGLRDSNLEPFTDASRR